ncbi:sugar nucleotide-binding protein [Virgibacillus oceani]
MKLLILGATGFLGSTLFHLAGNRNLQVIGTSRYLNENRKIIEVDVTNKHALKSTMESYDPDVVVWTLLSRENEDVLIDHGLTNLLSIIKSETKLIFLSTDAVFTGGKGGYKEADILNSLPNKAPLATYVNAKIRAERQIAESHKNHTIIRTGPLYGMDANGNIEARTQKMTRQLEQKGSVEAAADFYKTFVHIVDLSKAILEFAFHDFKGVIHLGPAEKESYFTFYKKRFESLGFISGGIEPIEIADGKENCLSVDTSLDTEKVRSMLKISFRSLND